jgi:rRNA pseudouridine-1189 N-methylase Emg1 (Nep1/Mra1 family)
VQLLQKLSIRASNGPDKLMRIVKQPVTRHLPLGARRIGKYAQVHALVTIVYFTSK